MNSRYRQVLAGIEASEHASHMARRRAVELELEFVRRAERIATAQRAATGATTVTRTKRLTRKRK